MRSRLGEPRGCDSGRREQAREKPVQRPIFSRLRRGATWTCGTVNGCIALVAPSAGTWRPGWYGKQSRPPVVHLSAITTSAVNLFAVNPCIWLWQEPAGPPGVSKTVLIATADFALSAHEIW